MPENFEELLQDYTDAVGERVTATGWGTGVMTSEREYKRCREALVAYVKTLEDERMEAINLLKQIEWIKDEWANYCPACNRPQYEGHQIDCVLLKLIKEREK